MAIYALGEHEPDIHPEAYVHPDATVIGVMPPLEAGDTFSADVLMEEHREYGYQYRVLNMVLEAQPTDLTEAGIAAYLEARVGGVGKVLAGRIANVAGIVDPFSNAEAPRNPPPRASRRAPVFAYSATERARQMEYTD